MAKAGVRNEECSLFVANLDPRVSEEILWELFLQAGPLKNVYIPCDRESGKQKTFAFVEFSSRASAHYAWELLDGIRLYDRELTVRLQSSENTGTARNMLNNEMPASDFYKYLYNKYEELKHRSQSEPRRGRWNEESSQRNHSFSHPTLNRSFSSPSNILQNTFPQMNQQLNVLNSGAWNTSTPQRVSTHQPIPFWNVSPYRGSPPYGASTPYGNSTSHHPTSSNTTNRSSPYGYNSRGQGQQYY